MRRWAQPQQEDVWQTSHYKVCLHFRPKYHIIPQAQDFRRKRGVHTCCKTWSRSLENMKKIGPPQVNSAPEQFIHWNRCSACAMRYWPCFATASPLLTAAEQRHVLRARPRTQPCWSWRWQTMCFLSIGRWTKPRYFWGFCVQKLV